MLENEVVPAVSLNFYKNGTENVALANELRAISESLISLNIN